MEELFFRNEIWSWVFLGNPFSRYAIAFITLLFAFSCMRFVKKFILCRLKSLVITGKLSQDSIISKLVEKYLFPLLFYIAFYFSVNELDLNPAVKRLVDWIGLIFVIVQTTRFAICVAVYFFEERWLKKEESRISPTTSAGIVGILKMFFWMLCFTLILDNLGFNLTTLITGLGIGGVAIALASQNILNDLFNYFVIFFDRPFEEGDFIVIGDFLGSVEHIGIKTTRLASLNGEEIILSNSDLTGSRVRNYKKMTRRRVTFRLGVTYQTGTDKLRKIPSVIKAIIDNTEDTMFNRCHFAEYGDFNLIIETSYLINGNDYNKYMDIHQEINLQIADSFKALGVEFAFPTQTVILEPAKQGEITR